MTYTDRHRAGPAAGRTWSRSMRIGGRRTTCRSEEGTITPFDMVMLNNLDAYASSPHPRTR